MANLDMKQLLLATQTLVSLTQGKTVHNLLSDLPFEEQRPLWIEFVIEWQKQGYTVEAYENAGYRMQSCHPMEYGEPTTIRIHPDTPKVISVTFL